MMAYVSHCTSTMDGNNAQVIWCKTPDSQSSMKRGNTRITSFQHTISTSKRHIYLDLESKEVVSPKKFYSFKYSTGWLSTKEHCTWHGKSIMNKKCNNDDKMKQCGIRWMPAQMQW